MVVRESIDLSFALSFVNHIDKELQYIISLSIYI